MDMTLRFCGRTLASRQQPIRIAYVPIPVCWTQGPEDPPIAPCSALPLAPRAAGSAVAPPASHRQLALWGRRPRHPAVHGRVRSPGQLLEVFGYAISRRLVRSHGLLNWPYYLFCLLSVSRAVSARPRTLIAVSLNDSVSYEATRARVTLRGCLWPLCWKTPVIAR
jgi:hypothetical protein